MRRWFLKKRKMSVCHSLSFVTDVSSKQGTHCWSIRDIEPKTNIFFFHTFAIDGVKNFIIQDDKKVIEKILLGTEKMTKIDNKIIK